MAKIDKFEDIETWQKARELTRRKFIRNATLGGIGWTILRDCRSVYGAPANTTIYTAHIGCSGRAGVFLADNPCCSVMTMGGKPAFLCDVNEQRAADAFKRFPEARKGNDYRAMFDKFHKEIDAVVVATGDYGHAPGSAAAIRAGKPVYCEKPLTVTVKEARMLADLAARHKVITQMGNQGGYNTKAVNMVWSGMIGDVREAHCWLTGRGPGRRPLPAGTPSIPRNLHWDLWLGPAPYRDYHPAWMGWGGWREFGTSGLGNRGAHSMATAFKALKIGELFECNPAEKHPIVKVSSECSELTLYSYPQWETMHWQVPARKDMPPVVVHWYCGDDKTYFTDKGLRARLEEIADHKFDWGDNGEKIWRDFLGSLIVGEKGVIHCGQYAGIEELLPRGKFDGAEPPDLLPKPMAGSGPRAWFDAIRSGTPAMCGFDVFTGHYSEFYLLGHVATLFPGEELEFDPVDCKIINNSLADQALRRQYRPGWNMEEAS